MFPAPGLNCTLASGGNKDTALTSTSRPAGLHLQDRPGRPEVHFEGWWLGGLCGPACPRVHAGLQSLPVAAARARLPGSAECCRAGRRQEAGGRPGRQGVKELDKGITSAECKRQGSEKEEILFLTLAVVWSQGRSRRQEDRKIGRQEDRRTEAEGQRQEDNKRTGHQVRTSRTRAGLWTS